MKRKYAYDEAIRASSDLRDEYDKRKAMLFMAVSVVIPVIVSMLFQYIYETVFGNMYTETAKYWFINNIIGTCNVTARVVVTAVLGYVLTKSRYGAVVFFAVCSLGTYIGGMTGDALNAIAEFIFQPEETLFSPLSLAVTVISATASVFVSCALYDKLVGLGEITPVSDSIYSSARKRIIGSYIIIFILETILSGAAVAVEMLLMQNTSLSGYSFLSSSGFPLLLSALNFAIVYFAGRGIRKNRADGLKLAACYNFPNALTNTVLRILMMICGAIVSLTGLDTYLIDITGMSQLSILTMLSTGGSSFITVIVNFVLCLWVVKYLFPPQVIEETEKEPFVPREVHLTGIYSDAESEQETE